MTVSELRAILDRISYLDWSFVVRSANGVLTMHVRFDSCGKEQHGRKWLISQHACESEVLQTALLAVLTAVEHECREDFHVDGLAIFGPHIEPAALKRACVNIQTRAALPVTA